MKALMRGEEVIAETDWTPWIVNNLAWLTGQEKDSEGNPLPGDGWTLVEDYEPPEEDVHDEGNTYVVDVPESEEITSPEEPKRSLLDELKEML